MDVAENRFWIDEYEFVVHKGSFRYITQSWSGPGWDFLIAGNCANDDPEESVFPYGAKLFAEAAPIRELLSNEDLCGQSVHLPLPYDDESGEPLFDLNVGEAHDLSDVRLTFVERKDNSYRLEMTGRISDTVLGQPSTLRLNAWIERLPDHAYPA